MYDIQSLPDVKILVDTFYNKVRCDHFIGPIFNDIIKDRWPEHLEKMYAFWQTVLLGGHTYFGSPFPPHSKLKVTEMHFKQWMFLFTQTVDELFTGEKASEAKWRAEKMAAMFLTKIEYYRNNRAISVI